MVKRKEKIEDPLKLLLPGVIYDYFELVHTEVSDQSEKPRMDSICLGIEFCWDTRKSPGWIVLDVRSIRGFD